MITPNILFRSLMLPAALGSLAVSSAAAPTYTFSGTVAPVCKVGSGSYSLSIDWRKNTSAQITFDGVVGTKVTQNGQVTSATQTYATSCNGATLHVSAPSTSTSSVAYTIALKNGAGTTTIATVNSGNSNVAISVPPTANFSITASATQGGSPSDGTYTATVTIQ